MTGFDRVRDGFFKERPRRSDLTEQPLCVGEVDSRGRADIRFTEAEHGLTIPFGIVNAQRLNQIRLRLDEIALPEARVSQEAAASPTLRRPCFAFSLAQKCLGNLPRKPELVDRDYSRSGCRMRYFCHAQLLSQDAVPICGTNWALPQSHMAAPPVL